MDNIKELREKVWEEYLEAIRNDEIRKQEVEQKSMTYGEATMRYGMKIMGEADDNGYPLYIALHGGGGSDTPDINNQQWEHMGIYYADSVKQGIYINPRGVRDTWDTHANPESYPLYDRLIENMIAFYNADPNRVYLCGYSAGGDGVYMVGPRMADRFAAVHMSAGHPNGTSVLNLYNTPIRLQVGQRDEAYDRHKVTVQYMQLLDKLQEEYNGGYVHSGFVNYEKGHNFKDWSEELQPVVADPYKWLEDDTAEETQADINVIHFLSQYTRKPMPEKVVWDLGNRANLRCTDSFYWLKANYDVNEGIVVARIDKSSNSVIIEKNTSKAPITVLLNDDMLDITKPVTVKSEAGEKTVNVEVDEKLLEQSTRERGDKNYQFFVQIEVK